MTLVPINLMPMPRLSFLLGGCVLGGLLSLSVMAQTPLDRTALMLQPQAHIRGARITLGEIAQLPVKASELARIDLGPAPLPGYRSRLGRAQIERRIRALAPQHSLIWEGASQVEITRAAVGFDVAAAVAAAQSHLEQQVQQRLAGQANRVDIRPEPTTLDVEVPPGVVTLRVQDLAPSQSLQARMWVGVDLLVDGVRARSIRLPFSVQAFRPLLVARQALTSGQRLDCAGFEPADVDLARFPDALPPEHCVSGAWRLQRPLAAGDVLTRSSLQHRPAVSHGDAVLLRLALGGVELESRATALADGELGQRLAVLPVAATGPVHAEVIAPGIVKVMNR